MDDLWNHQKNVNKLIDIFVLLFHVLSPLEMALIQGYDYFYKISSKLFTVL